MSGKDGGWVLPDNIDAPTRCYQIEIPDDPLYIAAFMGALWELQYWENWQRDPAHKGIQVARRLRPLLENIKYCDGSPAVNRGYAGAGGGDDDPMIRQNPDNPCELQNSVDGVTWCTWADLSLCIPSGSQPGGDSHQPAPDGGEACYNGQMAANSQWLLPTVVSTGDVIALSGFGGAASDAPLGPWTCPQGDVFFGGLCIGGTGGFAGGDPLPTEKHGAIIASIGGVWYPIASGPLTVPGGVSNASVYLQMNDSAIDNNSGEYTFQACVTNNQTSGWSHRLDFRLSPYGFQACHRVALTTPLATWVPGVGWQSTFGADGFPYNLLYIYRDPLPSAIYSAIADVYTSPVNMDAQIAGPGSVTGLTVKFGAIIPTAAGTNVIASQAVTPYTATNFRIDLEETSSGVSHLITLQEITLSGTGGNPF